MRLRALLLAYLIRGLLTILLWTCRVEVVGLEHLKKAQAQGPTILILWHNRLLIIGHILSKFTPHFSYSAFISQSRDGEILAQFVNSFKNGHTIRVAHNAKDKALRSLIQELKTKKHIVILTPDGPRGPKYEMKPGVVLAAAEACAVTVPCAWTANRFWQLRTWDGLIIPKPFSKINLRFGQSLEETKNEELDVGKFQLEMNLLTKLVCQKTSTNQRLWPQ